MRAILILSFFAWALTVTPARAVHDDGIFQLDGDASEALCGGTVGGPSSFGGTVGCTGEDWDRLYSCSGTPEGDCTTAVPCDTTGTGVVNTTVCPNASTANHATAISALVFDPAPLSIFTQGGSKDEKDITQWMWVNGSVPDKDDLVEAFAALYVGPTGSPRPGHKIIYFGANRLSVNGDAQIGFWFLQNPVALGGDGKNASPFVDGTTGSAVSHRVGDILILSNFVQGGGSSNIQVYKVNKVITKANTKCDVGDVESKGSTGDLCLRQLANGNAGANGVCNPTITTITPNIPADSACAATNGIIVPALDPGFEPKSGATTGNYAPVGFFEGGLDLNSFGLQNECFAAFVVETRSSQSIDAVLKDFTVGGFEHCVAEIETHIHDASDNDVTDGSVIPGTVIHDIATVTGVLGGPDPGKNGSGTCTTSRPCTVTFKRFANTTCTGTTFTPQTADCLSDGMGSGTCTATTPSFTTQASQAGSGYSYLATYNGDSNYPPIGLPAALCEVVSVGKLDSAISTDIFKVTDVGPPIVLGDTFTDNHIDLAGAATVSVVDQATVTRLGGTCGGTGEPPCPSGNVTFTRFGNGACSGTGTMETPVALDSNSQALSSIFSLGANGLSYMVTYGGDTIYNMATVSRCEPVCAIDTTK